MIAPLQGTDSKTGRRNQAFSKARRAVGAALFQVEPDDCPEPRKVPAWTAWMFTAWVLLAAAYYFASMLGLT